MERVRAEVHLLIHREVPKPCSELLSEIICSQIHPLSKLAADPFSQFPGTLHPSAFIQLFIAESPPALPFQNHVKVF